MEEELLTADEAQAIVEEWLAAFPDTTMTRGEIIAMIAPKPRDDKNKPLN